MIFVRCSDRWCREAMVLHIAWTVEVKPRREALELVDDVVAL